MDTGVDEQCVRSERGTCSVVELRSIQIETFVFNENEELVLIAQEEAFTGTCSEQFADQIYGDTSACF